MKAKSLWTKDFTLITVGTIISAIAGQTISLPLSLMVFDETGSTFLSAILFISSMVPNVILPILIAPIIDSKPKKWIIVGLDYLTAIIYFIIAYIVSKTGFVYGIYLGFSFIAGTIGTVYHLAYQAWFPDLIPLGFEQKGYAISSSIYPSIMIFMAPVAAYLYKVLPIYKIFIIIGFLTIVAASFETFINNIHHTAEVIKFSFEEYKKDMLKGFEFLKKEKGIRNIYTYMSVTFGVANSISIMIQAYFQTVSFLSVTMLAFLRSSETLGRILGGGVQYKIDIPPEKRYGITKFVYVFYETMDILLLFMPYPMMIVNRFVCGFLGMTSATLRETSVQSYLPANVRAKVNAVFNVFMALSIIIFQMIGGFLGDIIGYRKVVVLLSTMSLIIVFIFIFLPTEENKKVYGAVREELQI